MTELHTFKAGDSVQTESGLEARIYAVHPDQAWMYIGEYRGEDGKWWPANWKEGGKKLPDGDSGRDLIHKPKPLEGFINVYSDGIHATREGANRGAKISPYGTRIACIDISDYEEGHGL